MDKIFVSCFYTFLGNKLKERGGTRGINMSRCIPRAKEFEVPSLGHLTNMGKRRHSVKVNVCNTILLGRKRMDVSPFMQCQKTLFQMQSHKDHNKFCESKAQLKLRETQLNYKIFKSMSIFHENIKHDSVLLLCFL